MTEPQLTVTEAAQNLISVVEDLAQEPGGNRRDTGRTLESHAGFYVETSRFIALRDALRRSAPQEQRPAGEEREALARHFEEVRAAHCSGFPDCYWCRMLDAAIDAASAGYRLGAASPRGRPTEQQQAGTGDAR
jgi:hypothetical protein